MAFVEMMDSYKEYKIGENKIVANNKINFSIEKGEFVIIVGPSGAGKSTLFPYTTLFRSTEWTRWSSPANQ